MPLLSASEMPVSGSDTHWSTPIVESCSSATVASLDPPSTTMCSKSRSSCACRLRIARSRPGARFRVAVITLKNGARDRSRPSRRHTRECRSSLRR
jgi:hypothetical protein